MIYEKKTDRTEVKREDLPLREQTAKRDGEKPSPILVPARNITKRRMRLAPGKRRRRGTGRGARLALALAVLAVVITADMRLFDGRMGRQLSGYLHSLGEGEVSVGAGGHNTLYTRLLTDVSQSIAEMPLQNDVSDTQNATQETEQTAAVSESVSASFVDGTRFYPITSLDLSADSLYTLSNATSYNPDTEKLASVTPAALSDISVGDEPLVLLIHTHGEECYTEYTDMYPENEATRSNDTGRNVVRVGKEIADTLSNFGIETVHCTEMHDSESFINAYSGSAAAVKEYLRQYPSIKIVVDVHRDAIIRDSGESIKAVTEIAGEDYAQLMFVVGTDEAGHNHPDWQDNLSFALAVQKNIDSTYPSLCRSINLRNVPFNQQLSSGYLLLEVGTSANTLEEALRSARAFGENLARTVLSA